MEDYVLTADNRLRRGSWLLNGTGDTGKHIVGV